MDICSLISCIGCETRACDKVQTCYIRGLEIVHIPGIIQCCSSFWLLKSWCAWQSLWLPFSPPGVIRACSAAWPTGRALGLAVGLQQWPRAVLPHDCLALGKDQNPWHMSPSPLFQTKWFADALGSWCVWSISGRHGGLGAGKKWLKSRMWKHELFCAATHGAFPKASLPQPARSGPIPAQRSLGWCSVQLERAPGVKEIIQWEQVVGFAATRY